MHRARNDKSPRIASRDFVAPQPAPVQLRSPESRVRRTPGCGDPLVTMTPRSDSQSLELGIGPIATLRDGAARDHLDRARS